MIFMLLGAIWILGLVTVAGLCVLARRGDEAQRAGHPEHVSTGHIVRRADEAIAA